MVKQILYSNDNIIRIMTGDPSTIGDENSDLSSLSELPVTLNDPRFRADEMIACPACKRKNAPNRLACLYCGADIALDPIRTDIAEINFRPPEVWEDGFSVVFAGKNGCDEEIASRAAEILKLDLGTLKKSINIGSPTPVAYQRSLPAAQLLATRLTEAGFECAIAGDDLLTPQISPTRIRGIEFSDAGMTMVEFNSAERRFFSTDIRLLLVNGTITRMTSETIGKRNKKRTTTVDNTEIVADEPVLDIYPTTDAFGFRVRSSGFDFSCLGDAMQKFSSENIRLLAEKLKGSFQSSEFIDGYRQARPEIDALWPLEERNESSNVSRVTFGGVRIKRVSVADNSRQFTMFSRLQRHFI